MFRASVRRRRQACQTSHIVVALSPEVCESRQLLDGSGLQGLLTGPNAATATAEYKVKDGVRSFEVAVLHGTQGAYSVVVAGETVGTIAVNSAGLGSMELTDDPHDADEFAFPVNWPGVAAGTVVAIEGLATGTLSEKGNDDAVTSSLYFTLSGSEFQTGKVEFEIETEHGSQRREFELSAYNLTPSTSYPLIVNGTTVATLSSTALGTLRVRYSDKIRLDAGPFPANFPVVDGTSTISLGTAVTSQAGSRPDDRGNDDGTTHLRVSLVSAGAMSGVAEFETIPAQGGFAAHDEFKVEIWNAQVGSTLSVKVDGVTVGTIVVASRGFGKLDFETGDNSKPFPGNWPGIHSGSVVEVGATLTGAFTGTGRLADPSNQNLDEAYRLDRTLQLTTSGNFFENHGGRGEKWLRSKGNQWHFITPDGALYKWNGAAGANGTLVTILDPSFYVNPALLFEAKSVRNLALDDDLLRASAAELDQELSLSLPSSVHEDWGGRGEKWVKGGSSWYFVTPDGVLTKWDGKAGAHGTVMAALDSRFHDDLTLLTDGTQKLRTEDRAFSLDRGLKLINPPSNFFNWGGRQEKWVLGDGHWFFITPDGKFSRWNGAAGANGTVVTTLATSYYDDTTTLASAAAVGSSASQAVLDDVFLDNPLL